jgi:hypothetical protein
MGGGVKMGAADGGHKRVGGNGGGLAVHEVEGREGRGGGAGGRAHLRVDARLFSSSHLQNV